MSLFHRYYPTVIIFVGYCTDRDDDGAINQADNAASLDEDRILQADALVYGDVQAHADVQEAAYWPLEAGAGAREDQPLLQFVRQRKIFFFNF